MNMGSDLLINVKYKNISKVTKDLRYHSQQERIFLADKGNYVFFISFAKQRKRHELVGYLIVDRKGIDKNDYWGKYTLFGKSGRFIKGKDFNEIRKKLSIKIGDSIGTAKSIGMSTQSIRTLNLDDRSLTLRFIQG